MNCLLPLLLTLPSPAPVQSPVTFEVATAATWDLYVDAPTGTPTQVKITLGLSLRRNSGIEAVTGRGYGLSSWDYGYYHRLPQPQEIGTPGSSKWVVSLDIPHAFPSQQPRIQYRELVGMTQASSPFDGIIDFAGPSGDTEISTRPEKSNVFIFTDPAVVQGFVSQTGGSIIKLKVTTAYTTDSWIVSHFGDTIDGRTITRNVGSVLVEYTY